MIHGSPGVSWCPHIDCVVARARSGAGAQCVRIQAEKRRRANRWKNQGVVDVRTVQPNNKMYTGFCSFHKSQQEQKCNDVQE
jgi:hypothetical protein